MLAHYGKFVAYFRVSTDRQDKSGLGLEAQREAVMNYLDGGRWTLTKEFTEVESGKRNDRPELVKALAACKRRKAKLVIAKLDRLGRNLAFIATLMESGVEFVAVDKRQRADGALPGRSRSARAGDDFGAQQGRATGRQAARATSRQSEPP